MGEALREMNGGRRQYPTISLDLVHASPGRLAACLRIFRQGSPRVLSLTVARGSCA